MYLLCQQGIATVRSRGEKEKSRASRRQNALEGSPSRSSYRRVSTSARHSATGRTSQMPAAEVTRNDLSNYNVLSMSFTEQTSSRGDLDESTNEKSTTAAIDVSGAHNKVVSMAPESMQTSEEATKGMWQSIDALLVAFVERANIDRLTSFGSFAS